MKTKLEELTAAQFIDLASGDTSVLHKKAELADAAALSKATSRIFFEYRQIIDEAGTRAYLERMGDSAKANAKLTLLRMCRNLMELGQYNRMREILEECGVDCGGMPGRRLAAEVLSRLARAMREAERVKEEAATDSHGITDIRKSFDEQTAAMMAHFKFQIDTSTMKATLYAHLVSRFNREIKAQLEALKKK